MRQVWSFALAACVIIISVLPAAAVSKVDAQDPNVQIEPAALKGLKYRLIGPYRGGRSTAVTGVPGQPHTFYMGATGGGVWKTVDAGESWKNVSDGFFKVGSIGAIAVAHSDSNVLYVGTGSADPRGNVSPGAGVYKSTDAGETWKQVGLLEAGQIGRIRIDPQDPDLVYVAALGHIFGPNEERGVFRSRDGGSSWEKVLYVSPQTGAMDLALDPRNPRILYAGMWRVERKAWTLISGSEEGGIYKSVDSGDSWEKLAGGLPEGVMGKIGITVSPVRSGRVWALLEAEKGGVYRSDDAGKSWTRVNKKRKLRQRAWYYTHIYADPLDAETVYALNTSFYKSVDAGKTFKRIRVLHGDCHDLWLNPKDPNILIQANDGGAHVSLNGGLSWSTLHNQPTAEIYRVTVDNQFPYRVYGPQQDNSTISVPSRASRATSPYQNWLSVGGCESGHIAVDPRDPNIVYAGCYGGSISRTNLKTGESRSILVYPQLQLGQAPKDLKYRFQWNAPIRLSSHNPDILYHTSQVVHRSADGGHSWDTISPDLTRNDKEHQNYAGEPITRDNTGVEVYGTIFAFEESPLEAGVLWAGSDDGLVHVSRDGGANWSNITPPDLPEESTVNMIELSRHSPGRAFVAAYRYRQDDFAPYIFRTTDYGQNWEVLTDGANGIPKDHFVRVVREDPDRKGLLYAGTEFGIYVSFDDGGHWQSLQLNLPVTPVTDLAVRRKDLVVATQGRSFWILDDLSALHQATRETAAAQFHLFKPREAYRVRFGGSERRGGENLPNGVILYYSLAEEAGETEVKLKIMDEAGEVIRTFSSKAKKEKPSDESFFGPSESRHLPAKAGLNRFVWNLRYPQVKKVKDAVIWGFTGGPLVLPGTYQARLSAGEWNQTVSFQVLKDPRIEATAGELKAKFDLMMEIRKELTSVYDDIRKIRSIRKQIQELSARMAESGYGDEAKESAKSIAEKLSALEGKLMQTQNESNQDPLNFPPMLDNQLAYVYGYVGSSEMEPTVGARERFADLKAQHGEISGELQQVVNEDVAAFSRAVREKDVPAILVPRKPE
ncbi:MAG: WD40/YVTN/BNR-like repeat-containing protein [Acidobacteriota bacterium]